MNGGMGVYGVSLVESFYVHQLGLRGCDSGLAD